LEAKVGHATNVFDVLDAFDAKLIIFQNNMRVEVVKVIKPFPQFLQAYDSHQLHNMFTLMLDLRFKSLRVVENYVGHGACICFVAKYDANAIIPLLMIVFEVLNPIVQACVVEVVGYVARFGDYIEKDNNIFNVGTSMEKSSCALVVKLSLFRRLSISLATCVDPLAWWWIHETQFPNVSFLVKQLLRILGSQIEIECVFNLASGLITLRHRL
jgi:hypothetical protein